MSIFSDFNFSFLNLITASAALCLRCSNSFLLLVLKILLQYSQDTSDNRKKSHTLNKCSSKNHVSTNVVCRFRLTSYRLYSTTTNLANTYTCTNSCKTGTDCTTRVRH